MGVTVVEDVVEDAESGAEATSIDLKLSEAIVVEGAVDDDGSVELHLIRPCVGRGRGKHLYTAEMLEANAGKFAGWKMYLNHLSEAARRALGGLPRDVRDTGGIVVESRWDPDVPAEGRFGKGAVVGKVKPVALVQELLRVDPRLVEASINATATGVKPGKVGSERVWIVEGIEEKGSVDWVTEAGAGGRVAQIMEALIDDGTAFTGTLDLLDDDTLTAWIERERPELAEAMRKGKKPSVGGTDPDGADSEDVDEALVKKFTEKGMPRDAAVKAAKKAMAAKKTTEGVEVAEITPEALAEALASDEGQAALRAGVTDAIKDLNLGAEISQLVEAQLGDAQQRIRVEAEATANRSNELRDLRESAHRIIEGSKLHPELQKQLVGRFDLIEGVPTADLNVLADVDESGKVTKSAGQKLAEAVDAAVADGLRLQAALNPTRVRDAGVRLVEGDGGSGDSDGDGGEGGKGGQKPDRVGPAARSLLEGAGIKDPDEAYEHGRKLLAAQGVA